MINLFNIPSHQINTQNLKHLLCDPIVFKFECEFADYVGAKYACFANSASSLIFLSLLDLNKTIRIPSIMPPVVPNAILNSGNQLEFYDDTEWVGGMYKLHDGIWDSAQEVTRNQFKIAKDNDVMIFSFYPTKPIGGCDGGMVVSNNRYIIENYRTMVNNGCTIGSSWNVEQKRVGYKMHGNSIQALIAYNNFKNLDQKNKILNEIRAEYNDKLNCANTSLHLYKIRVDNNKEFLQEMKYKGIQCGIHYGACHNNPIFRNRHKSDALPKSELEEKQTISIPFHENLTNKDVDKVIKNVKKLRKI